MYKFRNLERKIAAQAAIAKYNVTKKLEETLTSKREGAFAFEYMIVLGIMVVFIALAWPKLTAILAKTVDAIVAFMTKQNNGIK